jgi:hypothetical protein
LNLLDENFPEDQRPALRQWGIPFRQIGREVSRLGIKDPEIIPLLHRLRRVTFFTQDRGFFKRALTHPAYCLVLLDVQADDAAWYVRRFLRHARFDAEAVRLGVVARVHHERIEFWQRRKAALQHAEWGADV